MFVSTKYLSLMKFVAGLGWRPLQLHAFSEPSERAPPSLVEGLSLPHEGFEPVGQKGTNRPPLLGRHDARLAQQIRVEFERDVGFHEKARVARWPRAAQYYVLLGPQKPMIIGDDCSVEAPCCQRMTSMQSYFAAARSPGGKSGQVRR